MKITKADIAKMITDINEGYNSMSSAGKALAQRAKRQFAKDYPDIKVGIDGREGWITVDGKKAVNVSQASGSPLSMEDVVDKMKQAYLGHPVQEGKTLKITKRSLRRMIKEALTSDSDFILGALAEMGYDPDQPPVMDANNIAIDDALAGYPGEFTYEDIIAALEDQKAASEIMGTRAGSYKGTTLPGGRKI